MSELWHAAVEGSTLLLVAFITWSVRALVKKSEMVDRHETKLKLHDLKIETLERSLHG
jgi:hypothetical protein